MDTSGVTIPRSYLKHLFTDLTKILDNAKGDSTTPTTPPPLSKHSSKSNSPKGPSEKVVYEQDDKNIISSLETITNELRWKLHDLSSEASNVVSSSDTINKKANDVFLSHSGGASSLPNVTSESGISRDKRDAACSLSLGTASDIDSVSNRRQTPLNGQTHDNYEKNAEFFSSHDQGNKMTRLKDKNHDIDNALNFDISASGFSNISEAPLGPLVFSRNLELGSKEFDWGYQSDLDIIEGNALSDEEEAIFTTTQQSIFPGNRNMHHSFRKIVSEWMHRTLHHHFPFFTYPFYTNEAKEVRVWNFFLDRPPRSTSVLELPVITSPHIRSKNIETEISLKQISLLNEQVANQHFYGTEEIDSTLPSHYDGVKGDSSFSSGHKNFLFTSSKEVNEAKHSHSSSSDEDGNEVLVDSDEVFQLFSETYNNSLSRIPSVNSIDFDIFSVKDSLDNLIEDSKLIFLSVVASILSQYSWIKTLNVDISLLSHFIVDLYSYYNEKNPFHNSKNAANTLQMVHLFFTQRQFGSFLTDFEIMSTLMAALCMHLGHSGVSNSFIAMIDHPFSSVFGNVHPNESVALTIFLNVLIRNGNNFLESHFRKKRPLGYDQNLCTFRELLTELTLEGGSGYFYSYTMQQLRHINIRGHSVETQLGTQLDSFPHSAADSEKAAFESSPQSIATPEGTSYPIEILGNRDSVNMPSSGDLRNKSSDKDPAFNPLGKATSLPTQLISPQLASQDDHFLSLCSTSANSIKNYQYPYLNSNFAHSPLTPLLNTSTSKGVATLLNEDMIHVLCGVLQVARMGFLFRPHELMVRWCTLFFVEELRQANAERFRKIFIIPSFVRLSLEAIAYQAHPYAAVMLIRALLSNTVHFFLKYFRNAIPLEATEYAQAHLRFYKSLDRRCFLWKHYIQQQASLSGNPSPASSLAPTEHVVFKSVELSSIAKNNSTDFASDLKKNDCKMASVDPAEGTNVSIPKFEEKSDFKKDVSNQINLVNFPKEKPLHSGKYLNNSSTTSNETGLPILSSSSAPHLSLSFSFTASSYQDEIMKGKIIPVDQTFPSGEAFKDAIPSDAFVSSSENREHAVLPRQLTKNTLMEQEIGVGPVFDDNEKSSEAHSHHSDSNNEPDGKSQNAESFYSGTDQERHTREGCKTDTKSPSTVFQEIPVEPIEDLEMIRSYLHKAHDISLVIPNWDYDISNVLALLQKVINFANSFDRHASKMAIINAKPKRSLSTVGSSCSHSESLSLPFSNEQSGLSHFHMVFEHIYILLDFFGTSIGDNLANELFETKLIFLAYQLNPNYIGEYCRYPIPETMDQCRTKASLIRSHENPPSPADCTLADLASLPPASSSQPSVSGPIWNMLKKNKGGQTPPIRSKTNQSALTSINTQQGRTNPFIVLLLHIYSTCMVSVKAVKHIDDMTNGNQDDKDKGTDSENDAEESPTDDSITNTSSKQEILATSVAVENSNEPSPTEACNHTDNSFDKIIVPSSHTAENIASSENKDDLIEPIFVTPTLVNKTECQNNIKVPFYSSCWSLNDQAPSVSTSTDQAFLSSGKVTEISYRDHVANPPGLRINNEGILSLNKKNSPYVITL